LRAPPAAQRAEAQGPFLLRRRVPDRLHECIHQGGADSEGGDRAGARSQAAVLQGEALTKTSHRGDSRWLIRKLLATLSATGSCSRKPKPMSTIGWPVLSSSSQRISAGS